MIGGLKVWLIFLIELKKVEVLLGRFNDFKFFYIPRRRIVIVDFLFRIIKDFYTDFFFIGCYFLV